MKGALLMSKVELPDGYLESMLKSFSHVENDDKRVYGSFNRVALKAAIVFLEEKGYEVTTKEVVKNAKSVLNVLNPKSGKEISIKILFSGLELAGKTRPFGSDLPLRPVKIQRAYLISDTDPVEDAYLFVDYHSKGKSFEIFAILPGKFIKRVMVDPLRARFIGKKACILQKEGYNSENEEPFSVLEIFKKIGKKND